ncbi:MAG: zf-HC2 domain-containing protein [Anaerolineales bacterium]|jgi:hypothetical protein
MHNPLDPHPDETTFHEYLDNELSLSEIEKFEKHLSVCQECVQNLSGLKDLFTQIQGIIPVETPKDISTLVVNEITHISKLEPLLQRTAWLQISIISILIAAVFSLVSIDNLQNILSPFFNNFISNIATSISIISSYFDSLSDHLLTLEIPFLNLPHQITPDNLPFHLLITFTVFSGLLWFVGNRILLPNSSIYYSQNGG